MDPVIKWIDKDPVATTFGSLKLTEACSCHPRYAVCNLASLINKSPIQAAGLGRPMPVQTVPDSYSGSALISFHLFESSFS